MRKKGKSFRRAASAPALVTRAFAPAEIRAREVVAILAIQQGFAEPKHFDDLLTCADILLLAATDRRCDDEAEIAHMARIALANIKDRYKQTGRLVATGEELKGLQVLREVSDDFWARHSTALFDAAQIGVAKYHNDIRRRKAA